MVAQRDDVRPGGEQRARHLRREAEAVRGVLGVDDRQIDPQRRAQHGQGGSRGLAAGAADDVAEKQDAHAAYSAFVRCTVQDDAALGRDGGKPHVVRPGGHLVHLLRRVGAAQRAGARERRRGCGRR